MILVTGAAGKTGRAVIQALGARGQPVRALVRREDQVRAVQTLGAREVLVGDMRRPEAVAGAMRGARAVYHIPPNMIPEEEAIGSSTLDAARQEGIEHFVYHSVLHPQIEAMPHHWRKLRVEERLLESGLEYTVLQPAAYMQNVLAHWGRITGDGIYPVPYALATRLDMVDLEDVAEAAAVVLTAAGHRAAIYELASGESLAQVDVAASLGRHLARAVRPEAVDRTEWERQALAAGLGSYTVSTLLAMFHHYERHGFHGNPRVLGWLLGRPPTTFDGFVRREVERWRKSAVGSS